MTLVQPPVWLTWRPGCDKNAVGSTAGQALPAFASRKVTTRLDIRGDPTLHPRESSAGRASLG